jgi:hypothetical protein
MENWGENTADRVGGRVLLLNTLAHLGDMSQGSHDWTVGKLAGDPLRRVWFEVRWQRDHKKWHALATNSPIVAVAGHRQAEKPAARALLELEPLELEGSCKMGPQRNSRTPPARPRTFPPAVAGFAAYCLHVRVLVLG